MVFGGKLFVLFVYEKGMLFCCIYKFENYDGEIFGYVEKFFIDLYNLCFWYFFLFGVRGGYS